MTNAEFLETNYDLLKTCCKYQMTKYGCPACLFDDLVQELSEIILKYPNEKILDVVNKHHENAWITACLVRTLYSKNSGFYREFRKFSSITDDYTGLEWKY